MAKNGTEAQVVRLPTCDFHRGEHLATYDFKTKNGIWGNGCTDAWKTHRMYSDLGTGKGQRLVLTT